jgi:hypothetical protein
LPTDVAVLSPRRGALRSAWLLVAAVAAIGGRPAPSDREVEAAFLCSFAEFVDWPEARETPLRILVLGEDPFGQLLEETLEGRPLQTKPIELRRSRRLEDAAQAQIVFVSGSEKPRLAEVLGEVADRAVLTVSDIPGFADKGGIIGFVVVDKRVRFDINERAAARSRLRISSRLLSLARNVESPARNDD